MQLRVYEWDLALVYMYGRELLDNFARLFVLFEIPWFEEDAEKLFFRLDSEAAWHFFPFLEIPLEPPGFLLHQFFLSSAGRDFPSSFALS